MVNIFFENIRLVSNSLLPGSTNQYSGIKKASLWEWITGRAVTVKINSADVSVNKASLHKFIRRNTNTETNNKPLSLSQHFFVQRNYQANLEKALVAYRGMTLPQDRELKIACDSGILQPTFDFSVTKFKTLDEKIAHLIKQTEKLHKLTSLYKKSSYENTAEKKQMRIQIDEALASLKKALMDTVYNFDIKGPPRELTIEIPMRIRLIWNAVIVGRTKETEEEKTTVL